MPTLADLGRSFLFHLSAPEATRGTGCTFARARAGRSPARVIALGCSDALQPPLIPHPALPSR